MKLFPDFRKRCILLLGFFLIIFECHSQYEDTSFVRYTIKEGLSSNYISSLEQDEQGYIWAGTEVGLIRFDGLRFKNFFREEHVQLPAGSIRHLRKFGSNQLGIISRKGMHLINSWDLSFRHYFIPDSTPFTTFLNAAWDAITLPDNSLALTTATGFYILNRDGTIRFRHDAFTAKDIGRSMRYGRDILQVNDQELLIYTYKKQLGLAHYNIKTGKYQEAGPEWNLFRVESGPVENTHTNLVPISSHEYLFFYLFTDSIGYFDLAKRRLVKTHLPFDTQTEVSWECKFVALNDSVFAVSSGRAGFYIFSLDRNTGHVRFQSRKYLSSYKINALYQDREKRLWVGTTKGILRQRIHENFLKSTHYPLQPGDFTEIGFQSALRYKDKLYLTRYSRSNGVVVVDTTTGEIVKRMTFYGSNSEWNEIVSVTMYHPDTLWLGSTKGILWLDLKSYKYGRLFDPQLYPLLPETSAIFSSIDRDGYAWICYLMMGSVVRYHVPSHSFTFFTDKSQPALPFTKIKSVVFDAFGDVWLGGHGLARWSNQKKQFDTLIRVYGGAGKFDDDILALAADDKGSLWLHNAENGLLEYRIRERKFVAYTMNDGLPSSVFQCLSPVVNGLLWIGCANSLTRFDTRTKESFIYDYNDGFPDESPNGRRMYHDAATGQLYMFFTNNFVKFSASSSQRSTMTGDLLVQEVRVNNKKSIYHPKDTLRLRHNENSIELQYNIIEFESPNSYQFAYRIDDDQNWTIAGSQRSLTLKGLRPGKHTILIKASGKNGEERLRLFTLLIRKPFWKTTGFILGCAVILSGVVYYLYRRRLNSVRQKANIDKLIAQTQMKALHAQMNPHFVFNSLNSIREMIQHNEGKQASHFLSKFAQLMRLTLDHSALSFISLRTTMDYLRRYMEMEQIRNDHFTCRILADEELDPDETLLPPMLIQPFIENAIWHGVSEDKKGININIDFKKEDEQLVCIIDDNGIGINRSLENKAINGESHTSVSISNIKTRIRLMNEKYGLESSVVIEDKSGLPEQTKGTRVTIRLPLQINE